LSAETPRTPFIDIDVKRGGHDRRSALAAERGQPPDALLVQEGNFVVG
jgi:hypothetical protein